MTSERWFSIECSLTWKAKATKRGRLKFQLAAKARPTSELVLSLWSTVQAGSHKGMSGRARKGERQDLHSLAIWPTVRASDFKSGHAPKAGRKTGAPLTETAMWATITATNANGNGYQVDRAGNKILTLTGQAKAGSSAQTGKPGALNPEFVCWLMGFPAGWNELSPSATRFCRKSLRKSALR